MEKRKLLFILSLTFLIFSCTSDDKKSTEQEEVLKFYKKTEVIENGNIVTSEEVFYNNDSKIQSIVRSVDFDRIYNVTYSGSEVTAIKEQWYQNINYNDIFYGNGSIILSSENSEKRLEIYHTNRFVDSTKTFQNYITYPEQYYKQTFTRNSENQLIANSDGDLQFVYSNFDNNKKLDPFGSVMEYFHSNIFRILDLEVTKNNPLTAQVGGSSYNSYLEYDDNGYVIRGSFEPNSNSYYEKHEYVEQ